MPANHRPRRYTRAQINARYRAAHPEKFTASQRRYRSTKVYKRRAAALMRKYRKLHAAANRLKRRAEFNWLYLPLVKESYRIIDHGQIHDLSPLEFLPDWYASRGPWECNCGWDHDDGWCYLTGDCAYRRCKDAPQKRAEL